jgi:predicted aspartyl protease
MRLTASLILVLVAALAAGADTTGVVPFRWTPGQIEVAVRVNGVPATFLLDTGAEYSVVSSRLASRLGLTLETRGSREFADGVALALNDIPLANQRVMVMPFDTYYQRGRDIEGLVGYDFFAAFVVSIDFKKLTLKVQPPASFKPPRAAVSVPIEFAGRLPVVRSVLKLGDGRALDARLMVDTGASQAVILRHPFATAHRLFDLGGARSTAPSLASGVRRMTAIPVEQVAVASWTFDRPAVLAFAEPVGSGGYTESDGLIGNTLLSRFVLHVDYARKRLLFEPAKR